MFSLESSVDAQNLRTGQLSDEEWEKLIESAGVIGRSNLFIDDTPGISISELRTKCRKLKLEKNLSMIIIDYLQLMSGSGKAESRQQEISEISRSLKGLAKELQVPVLALSQLNRSVDQIFVSPGLSSRMLTLLCLFIVMTITIMILIRRTLLKLS